MKGFIREQVRILKNVLVVAFFGAFLFYAFRLNDPALWEWAREQITLREIVPQYIYQRPPKRPIEEIIEVEARKSGIPALIPMVIAEKESGTNLSDEAREVRVRYEPQLYEKFRTKWKPWMNEDERRAYASSWGATQIVFGFWSDLCGLKSYAELLDREVAVQCQMVVIKDCFRRIGQQGNDAYDRLWKVFSCYNGSGDRAARYADQAMQRMMRLAVNKMFDDIEVVEQHQHLAQVLAKEVQDG